VERWGFVFFIWLGSGKREERGKGEMEDGK
jgi:hypothetical protein